MLQARQELAAAADTKKQLEQALVKVVQVGKVFAVAYTCDRAVGQAAYLEPGIRVLRGTMVVSHAHLMTCCRRPSWVWRELREGGRQMPHSGL